MAELDVLVPEPEVVKTVKGEVVVIPPVSWGREVRILRIVKDIMAKLSASNLFNMNIKTDENGNALITDEQQTEIVGQIMTLLLETATEKLTEAAAAITNRDPKWVEDNLDMEGILNIIVPFLRSKRDSLSATMQKYLSPSVTEASQ